MRKKVNQSVLFARLEGEPNMSFRFWPKMASLMLSTFQKACLVTHLVLVGLHADCLLYLPMSLAIAALCIFAVRLAWRAQRERVATGVEGLAGEIGVVTTSIDPEGRVFVHGETWNAVSTAGPLAKGEKVRIRSVQSMQLSVEPVVRSADV